MNDKADRLFEVAESQQGYFTAGQAVECGYPTSSHVYHLKAGTWQREYRGICRLTRFPAMEYAQYALWALWSRNRQGVPQGVYSHQTALSLYDLSDLMPSRLHMTVPAGFRRNVPIPDILILHKGNIAADEIEEREGYRVTRPIRAVTDLLADSSVSVDHIRQALREGLKRGLVARAEIERHAQRQALNILLRGGQP
jgi:predicted transcriptional regulator of viral defense system